jgi:sugar/nucleoside kinase (ribokinase family)
MPSLLVIGALALDRPMRLDRPLSSGGRLRASSLAGELAGRLGGGGANAGCALAAAGHAVRLAAIVADDADGDRARRLAQAAGLDLGLTCIRSGVSARTLVLIEPSGERTIIGLDAPAADPSLALGPPPRDPPLLVDGVFVRAAYPDAAAWARAAAGPVVLHWPAPGYDGPADVVVASADDLPQALAAEPFAAAAGRFGPRLRWAVVTHGAAGAVAHGADGARVEARVQPVATRDATGAGDAFAAGLLDALVAGAPIEPALAHGCAWGAAAAGLDGSAPTDAPPATFRPWSGEALAELA